MLKTGAWRSSKEANRFISFEMVQRTVKVNTHDRKSRL